MNLQSLCKVHNPLSLAAIQKPKLCIFHKTYRYISDLPMSLFAQVSIPWDHCNVCGLQQREEHSFHLGCVWIAVVKLWVIIVHLLWDMIKIFLYPFFTHIDILCSLSFQVCLLMFARTFQQGSALQQLSFETCKLHYSLTTYLLI